MKSVNSRIRLGTALVALLQTFTASGGLSAPQVSEWLIKTWETDDGLPENSATAMIQTQDGYLWFGTFKGLVRFDGVRFDVLDRSNTPGLPSDGIVNLHLDRKDRLWVSTLGGLVYRKGAEWRLVGSQILTNDYVRTFTERANGDLLLTTFYGRVLQFENDQLTQLPPPPGTAGGGYLGAVDEDGRWWVAQDKFVGRWNEGHWEPTAPEQDFRTITPSRIGLTAARDGGFWLLLNSELRRYSHGLEVTRRLLSGLPGNYWSMTEDSRGNVWICTIDQGVCQVLPSGEMVRWDEQNGISYHGTRFVFEDRESNLWIGTSGGGLQRLKSRRFQAFGPESGLAERVIKSVSPSPGGGIWIGTYGEGLFQWMEAGITNVPVVGWTNRHLYVQSVLSDTKGRTWLGSYGPGLFMLADGNWQHFPIEQTGGNNVIALFEDSRGRIWISGGEGIASFDGGILHNYGSEQGLPASAVVCFGEDQSHNVWLSDLEKVFRWEKERFVEVKDGDGTSIRGVTCLKGEPDGEMWMGSIGAGLIRCKNGMVSRIGVESGLPVANVHGILEDGNGYFWMPSNRGVMRAKRSELQAVAGGAASRMVCQLLDVNDGLPSIECPSRQQPSCARDANGRLWFSTIKGVARIDPAKFHLNLLVPVAQIEAVVYHAGARNAVRNDRPRHRIDAPFSFPLELPAGSHGIEIHYTAPSFASAEKVSFQISVDSEAADWRDVGNRRVAYFDEMPTGRHLFRVRAANDDRLWNQSGTTLALTVLPFFWQTNWFRALLLVSLVGLGLGWIKRLKARLEAKRIVQEAFTQQLILSQENERKRIASELHDGLGQDLLLIKNRLALLSTNAPAETARQIAEISATTSRAIRDVRTISHGLRPSALEQVGLTRAIEWMVEQNAEISSTKFSAELQNIDHLLAPEMEINLYRIVQEALNNVIKHAGASEVIIQTTKQFAQISVSVFDNGRGFEAEQTNGNGESHSGLGLIGMRERSKVLGGRIEIRSETGIGTRVTVDVPLGKQTK